MKTGLGGQSTERKILRILEFISLIAIEIFLKSIFYIVIIVININYILYDFDIIIKIIHYFRNNTYYHTSEGI